MLYRIRVALMWVLLAALPLQGFAAASMLGCGPNHHRASVTAPTEAAAPGSDAVHHHTASGDHDHADKAGSKCSVCAACCVGAALPAAALVFAAAAPPEVPTTLLWMGAVGFLTDGPDRPPRSLLV